MYGLSFTHLMFQLLLSLEILPRKIVDGFWSGKLLFSFVK